MNTMNGHHSTLRRVTFWVAMTSAVASAQDRVVFESDGEIIVTEGQLCDRKADEGDGFGFGFEGFITSTLDDNYVATNTRILFETQIWELPSYADEATIILNGFAVSYQKKDHHIRGTGVKIGSQERFGQVLLWDAGIDLLDRSGNDGIDACIYYHGVAWNSEAIDASVDQSYAMRSSGRKETVPSLSWTVNDASDGNSDNFAPIPNAYLFAADDGDRHLLQIAYSLIHPAFAEPSGSIEAIGIMKDNDKDSDVIFASDVDAIHGSSVGWDYTPFRPLPASKTCGWWPPFVGCVTAPNQLDHPFAESLVVEGSRYDFVIPILMGFDLSYDQNDEHVKHIRASISGVFYDVSTGQLSYRLTVGLTDKSGHKFLGKSNVMFLGFNRRPGPLPIPDLPVDAGFWLESPWRPSER